MNDDDLSELILRASAYLDGELDAAETAHAEADPAVMAEVAALRDLQASVREVPGPDDAVRESAIAAALAEFDALNAAHVPVPPADDEPLHLHRPHAPVVPFRPRPSYTRWLTAAAAVVAVGLLGVVVVNGTGGGDDEDQAAVIEEPRPEASRVGAEAEGAFAEESATAEESAPAAATEIAAADAGDATFSAPATTAAAAADVAGGAEESADSLQVTAAPFPKFDPERPITSPEELAAVGAELLAGEAAGTIAQSVETSCSDLAPFVPYQPGRYDDGAGVRDVVIAIDVTGRQVGAFDADGCMPVAVAPLP